VSRVPTVWATAILLAALLTAVAPPVAEAKGGRPRPSSPSGNDIGWPQCGGAYPHGQAFGIVGLNHGLANNLNQCLAAELAWAAASAGSTALPRASLYVNTADPGQVIDQIGDWPVDNLDAAGNSEDPQAAGVYFPDPFGQCDGTDSLACSWQYGWDRAIADVLWLESTTGAGAPSSYPWWLDVETGNTWESGSPDALLRNAADLEGMVAAIQAFGGATRIGVYSTSYQWGVITGGTSGQATLAGAPNTLAHLPDWVPGAQTQSAAQANCGLASFTDGVVEIAQWFGRFDGDVSCAG
jgi:hypothetical protein